MLVLLSVTLIGSTCHLASGIKLVLSCPCILAEHVATWLYRVLNIYSKLLEQWACHGQRLQLKSTQSTDAGLDKIYSSKCLSRVFSHVYYSCRLQKAHITSRWNTVKTLPQQHSRQWTWGVNQCNLLGNFFQIAMDFDLSNFLNSAWWKAAAPATCPTRLCLIVLWPLDLSWHWHMNTWTTMTGSTAESLSLKSGYLLRFLSNSWKENKSICCFHDAYLW